MGFRSHRAAMACLALAATAAGPCAADPTAKPRLGLDLEYEYFDYLSTPDPEWVTTRNAITAVPRLDWAPRTDLLTRASVVIRKDFAEEERSRVFAYEAFFAADREHWSFAAGRQILTWGRADAFKLTDVWKRHDFTDLIENRVEGTDIVRATFGGGSRSLELVWAPVFTPDVVSYAAENRWTGLPRTVDVPGLGAVALTFEEDQRRQPPSTAASGQVGARFAGTAAGWDFAALAYYGYDRVPTIVRRVTETVDPIARTAVVRLEPIHDRITLIGGDFATAIAKWTLRGEATYTFTADPPPGTIGINDSYFRFTEGVDRTFSGGGDQRLSLIVEYALDTEPEQPVPLESVEFNPLLHPYRQALAIDAVWTIREPISVNVKGYLNLLRSDFLVQSEVVWKPTDALTVAFGGDTIGGDTSTFFGRYRDNDRLRLRVSYVF